MRRHWRGARCRVRCHGDARHGRPGLRRTRDGFRRERGVPGDAPSRGELHIALLCRVRGRRHHEQVVARIERDLVAGQGLRTSVDGEREGRRVDVQHHHGQAAAKFCDALAHRMQAIGWQPRAALGEVALIGCDRLLVPTQARVRPGEVEEHHRDGAQSVRLLEGHDGVGEASGLHVGDAPIEGAAGLGVRGRGLSKRERGAEHHEGGEDRGAGIHSG